jgi:hypothetical protein
MRTPGRIEAQRIRERALFDKLRDNGIRKNLRLEQERVVFQWVEAALRTKWRGP